MRFNSGFEGLNMLSAILSKLSEPCYHFYICGRQHFISALETGGIRQATHFLRIMKIGVGTSVKILYVVQTYFLTRTCFLNEF
jgi:hypothetical protein